MLRGSLRVDVEDDGVRTGDWLASRDEGDEVPSLESLLFLEDFAASLPRESLWLNRFIMACEAISISQSHSGNNDIEEPEAVQPAP